MTIHPLKPNLRSLPNLTHGTIYFLYIPRRDMTYSGWPSYMTERTEENNPKFKSRFWNTVNTYIFILVVCRRKKINHKSAKIMKILIRKTWCPRMLSFHRALLSMYFRYIMCMHTTQSRTVWYYNNMVVSTHWSEISSGVLAAFLFRDISSMRKIYLGAAVQRGNNSKYIRFLYTFHLSKHRCTRQLRSTIDSYYYYYYCYRLLNNS